MEQYKKELDRLYTGYIEPILSGEQEVMPWWDIMDKEKPDFGDGTISRCSYEDYEFISTNFSVLDRALPEDKIYFFPKMKDEVDINKFKDLTDGLFFNDIVDTMSEEVGTIVERSNVPLYYRSHEGHNGFLGWHTNCSNPEDRWYFVYNTDNNSSFLRYIENGKMITKWEPKGWSLNHFTITDCDNPFWHCIYTNSHRFSFGIRPKIK